MKKFSILIAHYNNWLYFQDCYQSILNQTYKNFEIVIVDDCSSDGSYDKLLELSQKDCNIKLFRNDVNSKVGFTKRRCVNEAKGDICGFLDPDDMINHNAIEESVSAYQNNDCVATYSRIKLIDKEGTITGDFKYTRSIKQNQKTFFNINFEIAHFFTFKKDAYEKTEGIQNDLIISEDQDLYLKMYEIGNILFINKPLYLYRIHDNGISQNKGKTEQQKDNWNIVLKNTCNRRNIDRLYNKKVNEIKDFPSFIFKKQNSLLSKIIRKLT